MTAEKTIQALFAEIERELDRDTGTSAAIATNMIRQLGKTIVSEMKSKQEFADRIARIVDPNFMSSPVAILQREGRAGLVAQLARLTPPKIKKIGTDRNLVATAELRGLDKDSLIALIAERAEKEAIRQQRP